MISVVIEWNTDENSTWINEKDRLSIPGEDVLTYPLSVIGPFDSDDEANKWMTDALEDNTDVFDMYLFHRDYPEDWYIANPKDFPDGYYRSEGQPRNAIVNVVHEPPMPIKRPIVRSNS